MTCKSLDSDSGMSAVMGIILITVIVVVSSAAAYTVVSTYELKEPVIADIDIESINLSNHQEVVLVHRGGDSFDVSEISIIISVNGETIDHNLIELPVNSAPGFFGGLGGVLHDWSKDNIWDYGDRGDFKIANNNTILNSGDQLKVTIVHRPTGTIISSPTRRI